jgi:hypothetical protein
VILGQTAALSALSLSRLSRLALLSAKMAWPGIQARTHRSRCIHGLNERILAFVEAVDRANFDAIPVLAFDAIVL